MNDKFQNQKNLCNPLTLPLCNINLIEASAGTGKTYTLIIIYLRLILGIHEKNSLYKHPLNVKKILVVTFSKLGISELKNKIKKKIQQMKLTCINGNNNDPLLCDLLHKINNKNLAISQLLLAEHTIDKASIYTIHGFCQRIMNYYPLESKMIFNYSLLQEKDEINIYQQMCEDFWRRFYYKLPIEIISIIHTYWKNPKQLMEDILPYLKGNIPNISYAFYTENTNIIEHHEKIITMIKKIKIEWNNSFNEVNEILNYHKTKKQIYSNKTLSHWLKKINQWSNHPTIDYNVPKELYNFHTSILKTIINNNQNITINTKLINSITEWYLNTPSLKSYIIIIAIKEIRKEINYEKENKFNIRYEDLIKIVEIILSNDKNNTIIKSIRKKYPIALIDEFQDTNEQQYNIFNKIYGNKKNGLILISDPKQAIYAFRGADIFNYIKIQKTIKIKKKLTINWRSSTNLINATNQLFQFNKLPFIFQEIPFIPLQSTSHNDKLKLIIKQQTQPAMNFWLYPKKITTLSEYQKIMAKQCVISISNILQHIKNKSIYLETQKQCNMLKESDITIIVRNSNEASIIKFYLTKYNIPSVYLSDKNSVFEEKEAKELLSLLKGILSITENTKNLNNILANNLLNIDAATINKINNCTQLWENTIEEFINYHKHWKQQGILPMLYKIMEKRKITKTILVMKHGEKKITNLLHLGELLQSHYLKINNEYKLLRWFELQIKTPNIFDNNQKLRLQNSENFIKIITIHKSKGLEFPLVMIPFSTIYSPIKHHLFHDNKTYQMNLDLNNYPQSLNLAKKEKLAEEIRLFYVAITRAIYQCHIGIGTIFRNKHKKISYEEFFYPYFSPIKYLIEHKENSDFNIFQKQLNILINKSNNNIKLHVIDTTKQLNIFTKDINKTLSIKKTTNKKINNTWKITSYTELNKNFSNEKNNSKRIPKNNINNKQNIKKHDITKLTTHNFPKGPLSGIFLHNIFASLNFKKKIDPKWLNIQMEKNNIHNNWLKFIIKWIKCILYTPLNNNSLILANLSQNDKNTELKFHFPINIINNAQKIDKICKSYDPLSKLCSNTNLPNIKGILKGSIDLVFRWKQRYYILDYKSNWLGESNSCYSILKIKKEMISNRYEFQYQIYTIALHKFLKFNLTNYEYYKNFGGIFFLFLRGINTIKSKNGIFFHKPKKEFIEKLNKLFTHN